MDNRRPTDEPDLGELAATVKDFPQQLRYLEDQRAVSGDAGTNRAIRLLLEELHEAALFWMYYAKEIAVSMAEESEALYYGRKVRSDELRECIGEDEDEDEEEDDQ
jgi:hypothetical protein